MVVVNTNVELKVTPLLVAEMLAEMNDDEQAQVFVELAAIASRWGLGNVDQWYAVGRHLRDCECSTGEARDLVRSIAVGVGPGCGS